MKGELAKEGRVAAALLARIAGEIQGELERIALVLAGRSSAGVGRRRQDVVDATRLDLVSLSRGSAVLEFAPHGDELQLFSIVDESIRAFMEGSARLGKEPAELPPGFDRGVVTGLRNLSKAVGRGVSSVTMELDGAPPVVIDGDFKDSLHELGFEPDQKRVTVTGRLHMGDFAPSALLCRIDGPDGHVTCDFDVELRDQVLAAMDQLVVGEGVAEFWPAGRGMRVLHLEQLDVLEEAGPTDLHELIRHQGVRPVGDTTELAAGTIEDFDEFLGAIHELRSR